MELVGSRYFTLMAAIHAVQHTLYPPRWFDYWPDADRHSRLVFIVRDIPTETLLERFRAGDPVLAETINTTGED
jgi:hypothetical protein